MESKRIDGGTLGMIILIICLIFLIFEGKCSAYTFESELDPQDIGKWTMIEISVSSSGVYLVVANPDPMAKIRVAVLKTLNSGEIIGYAYLKNDELFVYVYANESYRQVMPTPEQTEAIKNWLIPHLRKTQTRR